MCDTTSTRDEASVSQAARANDAPGEAESGHSPPPPREPMPLWVPFLCAALVGDVTVGFFAFGPGLDDPLAGPFILGVAALGLLIGVGLWFLDRFRRVEDEFPMHAVALGIVAAGLTALLILAPAPPGETIAGENILIAAGLLTWCWAMAITELGAWLGNQRCAWLEGKLALFGGGFLVVWLGGSWLWDLTSGSRPIGAGAATTLVLLPLWLGIGWLIYRAGEFGLPLIVVWPVFAFGKAPLGFAMLLAIVGGAIYVAAWLGERWGHPVWGALSGAMVLGVGAAALGWSQHGRTRTHTDTHRPS